MSLAGMKRKIRTDQGWFFRTLRTVRRGALTLHVPVFWLTRPVFRGLYLVHVFVRDGLELVLKFLWYEPLFRGRCRSVGPGFHMEKLPYIVGDGEIVVGREVRLSGKSTLGFNNRFGRPELVIGDRTFIGHNCFFAVARSIRIGSDCLLAESVRVADNDGHPLDQERRRAGEPVSEGDIKPVVIEDGVWIGARATVLKGVTIGPGAVVGTEAVVTRDVPARTVVAGNPARVIRQLRDKEQT